MMCPVTRKIFAITIFISIAIICHPQPNNPDPFESGTITKAEPRPFKVLTAGRQITIKSAKTIKTIMVWTSGGHRIVEQKAVNASSYTFNITINEKIFFVMLRLQDDKIYTEKIGVQ